jgi:hypothetical protein
METEIIRESGFESRAPVDLLPENPFSDAAIAMRKFKAGFSQFSNRQPGKAKRAYENRKKPFVPYASWSFVHWKHTGIERTRNIRKRKPYHL